MSHPNLDRDRFGTALAGELAIELGNRVVAACAERGVVSMPLKGVLLLARWPELRGLRGLVDVDLLVRAADFGAVTEVLRSLGFERTVLCSAGSTFVSDGYPLSVDLHHTLFPHGLFRVPTDEVFARAALDDALFAAPVARMSDKDLFAHLVGHFVKGRGWFRHDTSLDDIRWLLKRGVFGNEDAEKLAAHCCELGLRLAAGYVLGHESFSNEPIAAEVYRLLRLSVLERTTVAVARLGDGGNEGEPRWWTPHLLDRSLVAGARSLLAHAHEAGQVRLGGFMARRAPRWHTRSATGATR